MAEYIEREALLRYLNDIWLSAMPSCEECWLDWLKEEATQNDS